MIRLVRIEHKTKFTWRGKKRFSVFLSEPRFNQDRARAFTSNDILARTARRSLLQKRLEDDFCWMVPHVPLRIQSVKGLNWTVFNIDGDPTLRSDRSGGARPVPELRIFPLEPSLTNETISSFAVTTGQTKLQLSPFCEWAVPENTDAEKVMD